MNASHESKNSLLMSQFMHKGAKNKNILILSKTIRLSWQMIIFLHRVSYMIFKYDIENEA